MKKKDQILLEEAYQKIREAVTSQAGDMRTADQRAEDWANRSRTKKAGNALSGPSSHNLPVHPAVAGGYNKTLGDTIARYHTGEIGSGVAKALLGMRADEIFQPGNYEKMKQALDAIIDDQGWAEGSNRPIWNKERLDDIAKGVQNDIQTRVTQRADQRETARKENISKDILQYNGEKQNQTIKMLEDAGFKRVTGDKYKKYDSANRLTPTKFYAKTIGSLLGRSRQENVVQVNPNGSIGEEGVDAADYLKYGKGRTFARGKKSLF